MLREEIKYLKNVNNFFSLIKQDTFFLLNSSHYNFYEYFLIAISFFLINHIANKKYKSLWKKNAWMK